MTQFRVYIKFFLEVNDFWKKSFKKSMWLQHFFSNELASINIPCFFVKKDRHQYDILDIKEDVILNLFFWILSNFCICKQTFLILEHFFKYTFVETLENRRTNSLTNSEFIIIVKIQVNYFDSDKSVSSIIVINNSKLNINFHNLTQKILYFIVLNLISLK